MVCLVCHNGHSFGIFHTDFPIPNFCEFRLRLPDLNCSSLWFPASKAMSSANIRLWIALSPTFTEVSSPSSLSYLLCHRMFHCSAQSVSLSHFSFSDSSASDSFITLCMKRLNRIADNRQPCRTPTVVGNLAPIPCSLTTAIFASLQSAAMRSGFVSYVVGPHCVP